MINKIIEDLKKFKDKAKKVFYGAYVKNKIAYISNVKTAFIINTDLDDGYYSSTNNRICDDIIKIDRELNGSQALTEDIYKRIKPTEYLCEFSPVNAKDLMNAINWSQKKLLPEQLYLLTKGLDKKQIIELNKAAKPSNIIHFEIINSVLYLNNTLFLPTQYRASEISETDLHFYIDSDYLKLVAEYSEKIYIRYSGYNKPITFICDKFIALIMPCIPGRTGIQQYSEYGRNYGGEQLQCIKSITNKEYPEIISTLQDCYYNDTPKKTKTQLYTVVKSFPDILKITEDSITKKNRYIYTTIDNGYLFTTNGICLLKLKSEEKAGSYISEDILDRYKPLQPIETTVTPIKQNSLDSVTPENKYLNCEIRINRDSFLEYINRTKFKLNGLEASKYIEFKVKENNVYINEIFVTTTSYVRDITLYFDNRYFDLVKFFNKEIKIKIYDDTVILSAHHNPIIITDCDNNILLLMPISYNKPQSDELNYFKFINGIRIDNRKITDYAKNNNITENSVTEMILNNSFKK